METYEDVLKAVSFAIGSAGTVKPERLAEAALQVIAEMGFVLFKPDYVNQKEAKKI